MKTLKLSSFIFLLLLSNNGLSQSPQKNEGVIKILCKNKVDKREILYNNDKGAWCDTTIVSFCALNKKQAIKRVCSNIYLNRLVRIERNEKGESIAAPEINNDVKKVEPFTNFEQEKMEIELEKLAIDQRKLDLRKRKLKLLKQDQ